MQTSVTKKWDHMHFSCEGVQAPYEKKSYVNDTLGVHSCKYHKACKYESESFSSYRKTTTCTIAVLQHIYL